MKYIIFLLLFAFSYTNSCNKKGTFIVGHNKQKVQHPEKTKFLILQLQGKDVSKEKLYITFDEERNTASGYAGCNTFSSTYTAEKESISFGFPIASKMYCKKKIQLEQDFFKAFMEVDLRTIKQDSLVLKNSNGIVLFSGIKTKK